MSIATRDRRPRPRLRTTPGGCVHTLRTCAPRGRDAIRHVEVRDSPRGSSRVFPLQERTPAHTTLGGRAEVSQLWRGEPTALSPVRLLRHTPCTGAGRAGGAEDGDGRVL